MANSMKMKSGGDRAKSKFRIRKKVAGTESRPRVSVFKSTKYIYAQVVDDVDGRTLVQASSREKEVLELIGGANDADKESTGSCKSVNAAKAVGLLLAKRCLERNVTTAVFDRNGWQYHGRVMALADGVRAGGVQI